MGPIFDADCRVSAVRRNPDTYDTGMSTRYLVSPETRILIEVVSSGVLLTALLLHLVSNKIAGIAMATKELQGVDLLQGTLDLLALVGLYGITRYCVARRPTDIGIRRALEGGHSRVVRAVFAEVLVCVGLAIGMAGTVAVTRLLASVLYCPKRTIAGCWCCSRSYFPGCRYRWIRTLPILPRVSVP